MRQNSGKRALNKGNGAVSGMAKKAPSKGVKKRKFKNTRLFKVLRIALLLIIILLIVNIIKDLIHRTPEKVSIVIKDDKIELVHDINIDKYNNVYMSIDDVKKLYDQNIYYSNKILITTYNKHIAVLELGKTTMKVNDVVQEIKGTLKEINGVVYLPFSDMVDVYDFSIIYNKDTKVLNIDSKLEEKKEAVVLKSCNLKESTNNFAKTLEKVKKSQYVTIFETKGDFTKIRTKAGNVGFVKTEKLSKPELVWENMDEDIIENVNILDDYAIVSSNYEILTTAGENSITTPDLFNIIKTPEGKIDVENVIDFGEKFEAYKKWAEDSNVSICPIVTLNCSMSEVCSNYETRSYIINTLYNNLINNKLSMICLDFTNIDDSEGLYRFATEMVPRFKCAGMKVLIKYNSSLNKDRLNSIVDYVID